MTRNIPHISVEADDQRPWDLLCLAKDINVEIVLCAPDTAQDDVGGSGGYGEECEKGAPDTNT